MTGPARTPQSSRKALAEAYEQAVKAEQDKRSRAAQAEKRSRTRLVMLSLGWVVALSGIGLLVARPDLFGLERHVETTVERTPPDEVPANDFLEIDQLTYLRQSRYCPSDRLSAFAAHELGHLAPGPELLAAVGDWVAGRLIYEEGSSGPLDSAVDSLFAGRGVCRDFAHLAIAMCRSVGIPARYVSGYLFTTSDATGEDPDAEAVRVQTHAWFEAAVPGVGWLALDPTNAAEVGLRHVKIGHGRDYDDVPPLRGLPVSVGGQPL